MFTLPGVNRYFSHMKKTESKSSKFDLGASRKFMRGAPSNSEQEKETRAQRAVRISICGETADDSFPSLLMSEENKRRHTLTCRAARRGEGCGPIVVSRNVINS